MTSKYGFFSEQVYIPPVALEGGKRSGSQQHKENATRPFRPVSGNHLGKGTDATFSAFTYVIEGDRTKRQSVAARLEAEPGAPGQERLRPFKPASPMKRATAPQAGEASGTISGRYEYIPDGGGLRRLKDGHIPAQPKNFVTRPSPHGGPGYPGATISQLVTLTGIVGEYAYYAEPYGQAFRAARAKAGDRSASKMPFRAACGSSSIGLFGKIQYEALGALTPKKPKRSNTRPFRPAFAGSTAAFSPQPEYMACPAMRPARAKGSGEHGSKHSWRPSHGSVTSATPSIVVMNLR